MSADCEQAWILCENPIGLPHQMQMPMLLSICIHILLFAWNASFDAGEQAFCALVHTMKKMILYSQKNRFF
jgi:hypothetical protein